MFVRQVLSAVRRVPSFGNPSLLSRSTLGSATNLFARGMATKPVVAPFQYQPLLELGPDDIPWRKLDTGNEELVRTINVGGLSFPF